MELFPHHRPFPISAGYISQILSSPLVHVLITVPRCIVASLIKCSPEGIFPVCGRTGIFEAPPWGCLHSVPASPNSKWAFLLQSKNGATYIYYCIFDIYQMVFLSLTACRQSLLLKYIYICFFFLVGRNFCPVKSITVT